MKMITDHPKKIAAIILVLLGVVFFLGRYLVNAPGEYINHVQQGYKGIIIDKYYKKATHLTIKTNEDEILDVALLSAPLLSQSAIDDSIEKLPGDNYVILNKNGKKLKLLYLHIPDYIRNDGRWPAQWKDKWYDTVEISPQLK